MPYTATLADDLVVPLPGFGAMSLSRAQSALQPETEELNVLRHAIKIGCTFWNTARIYGNDQHNEKLVGIVLREGDNRSKVVITTKWGLKPHPTARMETDGSAKFARQCIDESIANLGSPPDIWLLHRIDANTPVEESVQAMEDARAEGKCRFIGLSCMSAQTLRRAAKVAKVDFVEMEFSPFERGIETNGVLDACKELGIKVITYSPLGHGILTGRFKKPEDFGEGDNRLSGIMPRLSEQNFATNMKLTEGIQLLATAKGCTPGQLALAWGMTIHGDLILPIPGTRSTKYLDENFGARNVNLTPEEVECINDLIKENPVQGEQYAQSYSSIWSQ